jgi:hypothetical protein
LYLGEVFFYFVSQKHKVARGFVESLASASVHTLG